MNQSHSILRRQNSCSSHIRLSNHYSVPNSSLPDSVPRDAELGGTAARYVGNVADKVEQIRSLSAYSSKPGGGRLSHRSRHAIADSTNQSSASARMRGEEAVCQGIFVRFRPFSPTPMQRHRLNQSPFAPLGNLSESDEPPHRRILAR